jgi:TRAP-type C4-dicarboxylate transport system permease small subunit
MSRAQALPAWVERALFLLFQRAGLFLTAATLGVALVVMTAQIFSRYVVGSSLVWAEELSRYALIWSTLIGAAVAYRQAQHVGVTVLLERLPSALAGPLLRVVHGLTLAFALVMVWQGGSLALRNFARDQLTPALQVPIAWANLAIPGGGLLLAIAALEALLKARPVSTIAVVEEPPRGDGR